MSEFQSTESFAFSGEVNLGSKRDTTGKRGRLDPDDTAQIRLMKKPSILLQSTRSWKSGNQEQNIHLPLKKMDRLRIKSRVS